MGGEMPAPLLLPFLLLLLLAPAPAPSAAAAASSSFALNFFPAAAAQLALSGGANATAAAVSMASPGARVQYRAPIVFPSAAGGLAFSTYFAFALPPSAASSLAFFLAPSAAAARSPPALAVVFSARHVRVDLAGRAAPHGQARYSPARSRTRSLLHAWIDYNATSATLRVRVSAARVRPSPPLLSCPLDLSPVLRSGPVLAGFRTPSGNCTLFSWAFHAAPYRMHSQPLNPTDLLTTPPRPPPPERRYSPWGAAVSLLFAAACGAMVTFFVLFLWYSVAARRPVAPVEYPMHTSDVVYQKIVLVGVKDDAATADDDGHPPPVVANE
ncbi:angiomotin-like [Panicum virgatum]|uniref:angiomotin-like n=1 Tax=Panicum virgatum TaxID=38727 RepID=UPI0019D62649|nr:angiomotin-like [Panicum virgatum]